MPVERLTPVGAINADGRTTFRVWAPHHDHVDVHIHAPFDKAIGLDGTESGYHEATVESVEPGAQYTFRLGAREFADPASRFQRDGVHGPSEVTETEFPWTDWGWRGPDLPDYVIYELHVGTFSAEGTFGGIVPHLDDLVRLGVTAVELMPVAQFPGARNWGYDGVFPYAPQNTYGGPAGLKRLVDECHARGLAVVLDVVYNHFGPEGCVVGEFGPYFTKRYRTPWGPAINFDDRGSDEVRNYFVGNALSWLDEFHVDALRLDAVHAIADVSATPFLEDLAVAVDAFGDRTKRNVYLIAESAANDARLLIPRDLGGLGVHAQWNDDFHHALVSRVTGDRTGYYIDYGSIEHVARAWRDGFVYQDEYSRFRDRRHGRSAESITPDKLVVYSSNHDHVGNRAMGDRPVARVSFEQLKLMAGCVLLSPFIPLLFMGEEYGEAAPFPYFVSHSDPGLIEAVRRGRREEFPDLGDEMPDPGAEQTFLSAKLDPDLRRAAPHAALLRYYTELLRVRRDLGAGDRAQATVLGDVLIAERENVVVLMNFAEDAAIVPFPAAGGVWPRIIDSAGEAWGGPGAPTPAVANGGAEIELRPFSVACFRRT